MISGHAERRMNQRGFNKSDVDLIYYLADVEPAPGGAERLVLTEKSIRAFRRTLDRIPKGATLILEGERIKTMYKSFRRSGGRRHTRKGEF